MSDTLRLTILGCGSSPGVPRISGDWGACDPHEPKNRRRRCAALIERVKPDGRRTTVVIDTGPDFREQMISARVRRLDAAVFTHPHADHIHGIDDLRGFVIEQRRRMDIWADRQTLDRLMEGFGYCFVRPPGSGYPPILEGHLIEHYEPFRVEGEGGALTFEPLPHQHGSIHSLGFRIGDGRPDGPLAYCPDVSGFPDRTVARLKGLELLVIDALQHHPHPSHFSLGQALEQIERLAPRRALLTHMHTPLDYVATQAATPACVEPAYDGLMIELALDGSSD